MKSGSKLQEHTLCYYDTKCYKATLNKNERSYPPPQKNQKVPSESKQGHSTVPNTTSKLVHLFNSSI